MAVITCPNCSHSVPVSVKLAVPDAPKRPTDATPLTAGALRAILEFMEERPGRYSVAELFLQYNENRSVYKGPKLTKQAFVMALQRNGATRWRTGVARGYEIPEITSEQRPAKVASTVQDRVNQQAFSNAVLDHSVDPAPKPEPRMHQTPSGEFFDLNELPFEVDFQN